ncbi:MAG: Maf family protein [Candidatus Azotimanducaceae bacterium WSBS_2022_MAG_OTU7]
MMIPRLILASTSPYRKQLLANLGVTFTQIAPATDESPHEGESPDLLARRLGISKARSVADQLQNEANWICIGSDQVCHLDGTLYGKPGMPEQAALQLAAFSGCWVTFSTSLALLTSDGQQFTAVEDYECRFRTLSADEIDTYVQFDQPLDCAGSIKVEQAGVSLLQDARGRDINSLYGLPLMLLSEALRSFSYSVFDFKKVS